MRKPGIHEFASWFPGFLIGFVEYRNEPAPAASLVTVLRDVGADLRRL